jgi:flagellar hook-length control protein FliK
MVQASSPSVAQPVAAPPKSEPLRTDSTNQQTSTPRTDAPAETQAATKPSRPESDTATKTDKRDAPDSAKAADKDSKPEKAEADPAKKADASEQTDASGAASASPTQVASDPSAAKLQLPVDPTQAPTTDPNPAANPVTNSLVVPTPQTVKTPDQPEEDPAAAPSPSSLPKGLDQKIEDGGKGQAKQPPLAEFLSLPRAELETPKLAPDSANPSQTDGKKDFQVDTGDAPGGAKTDLSKTLDLGKTPDLTADAGTTLAKVFQLIEPAMTGLGKTENTAPTVTKPSTQTQDAPLVPQLEGIKVAANSTSTVAAAAEVRASPVLAQVEGSIRWILQNKNQGAELQLHPDSLGRVIIQLRVDGQDVHAKLWASEASSMSVLQDHKAFLEASLKQQGLNLSSFDLQSGARGNGAQTMHQERAPVNLPQELPHLESEQDLPVVLGPGSLEAHQIEVYA